VDNQHKKIKGYRDLSQAEIDLMNEAKELAEKCGEFCAKLEESHAIELEATKNFEHRVELMDAILWYKKGKRDIQVAFMEIIRSVARPTTF